MHRIDRRKIIEHRAGGADDLVGRKLGNPVVRSLAQTITDGRLIQAFNVSGNRN